MNGRRVRIEMNSRSRSVLPVVSSFVVCSGSTGCCRISFGLQVAHRLRLRLVRRHARRHSAGRSNTRPRLRARPRALAGEVHGSPVSSASLPKSNSSFRSFLPRCTSGRSTVNGQPAFERNHRADRSSCRAGTARLRPARTCGRPGSCRTRTAAILGRLCRCTCSGGSSPTTPPQLAGRRRASRSRRHRVVVVLLRLLDDVLRHLGDLAHELLALELAVLDLRELELPLTGGLGLRELLDAEARSSVMS